HPADRATACVGLARRGFGPLGHGCQLRGSRATWPRQPGAHESNRKPAQSRSRLAGTLALPAASRPRPAGADAAPGLDRGCGARLAGTTAALAQAPTRDVEPSATMRVLAGPEENFWIPWRIAWRWGRGRGSPPALCCGATGAAAKIAIAPGVMPCLPRRNV